MLLRMRKLSMRLTSMALAVVLLQVSLVDAQIYSVTEIGGFPDSDGVSIATDVDDLGQVVGGREIDGLANAFLWSNGTITEFGNESGEYRFVSASDINNLGQVVGSRYLSGGRSSAFLWENGMTIDLGRLPAEPRDSQETLADSINDAGIVTGRSSGRPFIWESGVMRDFRTFPGANAFDSVGPINNRGVIAGTIRRDDTISFLHAARWTNGEAIDLGDFPGGTLMLSGNYSEPSAMNDVGQVVGYSDGANGYHAFFWSDGIMTDLGALPGLVNRSEATDINDRGVVVGYSGAEIGHAFIWDSINGMRDLNSLLDESGTGWQLNRAYGINNHGQIVGFGLHDGMRRGYLLTPIPEPSTLATAAVALACATFIATRRLFRRGGKVPG